MKKLIVDCLSGQIRSVIIENERLEEIIIEDRNKDAVAGGIYAGRVEKVLSDGFAFVNIGDEKNAFLQLDGSISLKEGDSIVVQVAKEAYGEKGSNLDTNLSFSGKYIVLTTDKRPVGVSAKIKSDERRAELLRLVCENMPYGYSGVVRTNSENASDSIIIQELKSLVNMAERVKKLGMYVKPPYELFRGYSETEKVIRDYLTDSVDIVIVNSPIVFNELKEKFPGINIQLYDGKIPVFHHYMVEKEIEKAMHKKVWLNCGGFLIIEPTEAMTVIDVNTGKFSGKNREYTILKTNLEAVDEIAHQIRLRNLSGMIIVDFIDMKDKSENDKLYARLKEVLKKDRIKTIVVGMTELGLMQITRQKIRKPLHSILKCPCACCNGSGMVDSSEYIISKIKNHIQSIFTETIYKNISVASNEKNIKKLKKDGFKNVFFEKYGGVVNFEVITTLQPDYYEIKYL